MGIKEIKNQKLNSKKKMNQKILKKTIKILLIIGMFSLALQSPLRLLANERLLAQLTSDQEQAKKSATVLPLPTSSQTTTYNNCMKNHKTEEFHPQKHRCGKRSGKTYYCDENRYCSSSKWCGWQEEYKNDANSKYNSHKYVEQVEACKTKAGIKIAPINWTDLQAISNPENFRRVESIIGDEDDFNTLFCMKKSMFTYKTFMEAVARYPGFCGEKDSVNRKNEDNSGYNTCMKNTKTELEHPSKHKCGPKNGKIYYCTKDRYCSSSHWCGWQSYYENESTKQYNYDAYLKKQIPCEKKYMEEVCKIELATMFAHMTQETGGQSDWHAKNKNCPVYRQTFANVEETKCVDDVTQCTEYDESCKSNYQGSTYWSKVLPCGKDKHYYGRGPFQLSHNYNYGPFSYMMTGSKTTYLNNPEKLATDGSVSMLSAFYFYMTPKGPKPSMHEVAAGFYTPNDNDSAKGFGSTINIINGEKECRSTSSEANKKKAINRKDMLLLWLTKFGIGSNSWGSTNTSCANMSEFNAKGWSNTRTLYWNKYWKGDKCKLTMDSSSIYPIQLDDAEKKCNDWVYEGPY